MPGYRDEREALRARNEALEADLFEARAKLAEAERRLALRDNPPETAPEEGVPPPGLAELLAASHAPVVTRAEAGALALQPAPPSPRLRAVAYGSAIVQLVVTPLVAFIARSAWPALVAVGVVAIVSSLMHLRPREGRQNGPAYYGLMALCGLVPVGGLFTPIPCIGVFGEYDKHSAMPYVLATAALWSTQLWFYLAIATLP